MSVPAGSSRSPAEEALDRMEERAAGSGISDEDVATVRAELERLTAENERLNRYIDQYILDVERLTEERDALQGRVYVLENLFPEDVRAEIGSAESEVSRLTGLLEHTREGLRDKDGQPILNAARSLLRATDNAERNAALGDLYNLLAASTPDGGGAK